MNVGSGVGDGVSVGVGVPVGTALASIAASAFGGSVGGIAGVNVGGMSTSENTGKSNGSAAGAVTVSTAGLSRVAVGKVVAVAGCNETSCELTVAGSTVDLHDVIVTSSNSAAAASRPRILRRMRLCKIRNPLVQPQ